jgi:hypothetical protein
MVPISREEGICNPLEVEVVVVNFSLSAVTGVKIVGDGFYTQDPNVLRQQRIERKEQAGGSRRRICIKVSRLPPGVDPRVSPPRSR